MYTREFQTDGKTITVNLKSDPNDGNVLLDLDYVGLPSRKISSHELSENLINLIPEKIGKSFFGDDDTGHITTKMLDGLHVLLQEHINQYGKFGEVDLIKYVAETIVFLESYFTQILNKPFEESEKKEHFLTYYKFYKMHLDGKYDEFLKNLK